MKLISKSYSGRIEVLGLDRAYWIGISLSILAVGILAYTLHLDFSEHDMALELLQTMPCIELENIILGKSDFNIHGHYEQLTAIHNLRCK